MTGTAESASERPAQRRFVFTTTEADALALEAILKPTDRGWRSLLGYALALPPLVLISWFTRHGEWPVWFVSFGVVGLVCWQAARFLLKTERAKAARQHAVGAGDIAFTQGRFKGMVGGATINNAAISGGVRIEMDASRLYILTEGQPTLILPLSAFADRSDMNAFAAELRQAGR